MSVYITGDTHGDFNRLKVFAKAMNPNISDTLIILGDAALNYYNDNKDANRKEFVSSFPFKTFCIHGNHEMRPNNISTYKLENYCGGKVWVEEKYPNIIFAKDGEIYNFNKQRCIAIGGAYSVDKYFRLKNGYKWFSDEQPSDEIRKEVEKKLMKLNFKIDIVLSHTCPLKYEPVETFLSDINQNTVDKSTEIWLDNIEDILSYKKWYCGHYHINKKIDRLQFLYDDIKLL